MLQTLTFNGARIINAAASFFRYESGSAGGADEGLKLRADGQDLGVYYPGDSVELPDQRKDWELTPTTPECAGIVRIGVGRVQSARLVGNVRVIDSGADKTQAGKQFLISTAQNADPAKVSVVHINASGERVAVRRLLISSAVAGTCTLGFYDSVGTSTPLQTQVYSKLKGGAALAPQVGANLLLAAAPTAGEVPGYLQQLRLFLVANQTLVLDLMTPFVFTGTAGLIVNGQAINRDLAVGFEGEVL